MIGKLITGEVRLDYTAVAEPLTLDDLNKDINDVRAGTHLLGPAARSVIDEIVLWEHQWDWLVKATCQIDRHERTDLWGEPVPEGEGKTVSRTIWGVPVKLK